MSVQPLDLGGFAVSVWFFGGASKLRQGSRRGRGQRGQPLPKYLD